MKDKIIRSAVGLLPAENISGLEDFRQRNIHHPGRDVPFHVTLLPQFYLPADITEEVENKLSEVAGECSRFSFVAHPLSSFPTTRVIYLTPSPSGPLEKLNDRLYEGFPDFRGNCIGYPPYHMTIASNYDDEKAVIEEFMETFGYRSIDLTAECLAVFCECEDGIWKVYKKYYLGVK